MGRSACCLPALLCALPWPWLSAWLSSLAGVFPCLAALMGRGIRGLLPLKLMWHVKNCSTKPASLTTEQQDSFREQSLHGQPPGPPGLPCVTAPTVPKAQLAPVAVLPYPLLSLQPQDSHTHPWDPPLREGAASYSWSLCHPLCCPAVTQRLHRALQSLVPRGVMVWPQLNNFLLPACPSWLTWLRCWCLGTEQLCMGHLCSTGLGPIVPLPVPCSPCSTATGAHCPTGHRPRAGGGAA